MGKILQKKGSRQACKCICAHQFALLPAAWASFAVELPQEKLSRNHTGATCHTISTLGNKIWMATTETKQFFMHLIHGNRPNLQKDYTTPLLVA